MPRLARSAAAKILVHSQVGTAVHNTVRREGDACGPAFEGDAVLIKDSRGFVASRDSSPDPGLEMHVSDFHECCSISLTVGAGPFTQREG